MRETNKILMCVEPGCKNIQGEDGETCQECWERLYGTTVHFWQKYGGGVKAEVTIKGVKYILDLDYLKAYLENEITERGYSISRLSRQKYPRIIINK
jgi:nitrogenase molybdenum-iron protein alpha/beta subunit